MYNDASYKGLTMDEKEKAQQNIKADSALDELEDESHGELDLPREMIPGFSEMRAHIKNDVDSRTLPRTSSAKYVAYTVKLPADQLAALQNIWLELKKLYGAHSPDKSGMIQLAIQDWLKRWEGPDKQKLLIELLEIREDTRRRQYKK